MFNWLLQYIFGYCTRWGLAAIGEPPLTKSLPLAVGKEPLPAMPVWIIQIFFALAAGRYIFSFLVSFFFFLPFGSRKYFSFFFKK